MRVLPGVAIAVVASARAVHAAPAPDQVASLVKALLAHNHDQKALAPTLPPDAIVGRATRPSSRRAGTR